MRVWLFIANTGVILSVRAVNLEHTVAAEQLLAQVDIETTFAAGMVKGLAK